ncbi:MAG: hypothetical protein ACLUGW_05915, partial [Oscillospiraceae bacterium]
LDHRAAAQRAAPKSLERVHGVVLVTSLEDGAQRVGQGIERRNARGEILAVGVAAAGYDDELLRRDVQQLRRLTGAVKRLLVLASLVLHGRLLRISYRSTSP